MFQNYQNIRKFYANNQKKIFFTPPQSLIFIHNCCIYFNDIYNINSYKYF